jgi:hypothetical protein
MHHNVLEEGNVIQYLYDERVGDRLTDRTPIERPFSKGSKVQRTDGFFLRVCTAFCYMHPTNIITTQRVPSCGASRVANYRLGGVFTPLVIVGG